MPAAMAPNLARENVILSPSIAITLSTNSVHYTHIVGSVERSADILCTVFANRALAVFLDDQENQLNLWKLPRRTEYVGGPAVPSYSEAHGGDIDFIPMQWTVKSVTGPEYPDYTGGVFGDKGDGRGISGLYWVFNRSLPGTVAFNLRNTIHTSVTTPPGEYQQSFRVAVSPIL